MFSSRPWWPRRAALTLALLLCSAVSHFAQEAATHNEPVRVTLLQVNDVLLKPEEAQVEPAMLMNFIRAAGEIAPQTDGRIKRNDE